MGDKVFKKALALFEKEYENHTGTGIIIQVLDIPNFYEQYETTEKDYLSNVALENHSSMLMFAIIEFYMEDKLFDVTMYAYSPKVNVSPAIQIPPIAFEHLDMLQEIYQQTIFDLLNEFEPIKRN